MSNAKAVFVSAAMASIYFLISFIKPQLWRFTDLAEVFFEIPGHRCSHFLMKFTNPGGGAPMQRRILHNEQLCYIATTIFLSSTPTFEFFHVCIHCPLPFKLLLHRRLPSRPFYQLSQYVFKSEPAQVLRHRTSGARCSHASQNHTMTKNWMPSSSHKYFDCCTHLHGATTSHKIAIKESQRAAHRSGHRKQYMKWQNRIKHNKMFNHICNVQEHLMYNYTKSPNTRPWTPIPNLQVCSRVLLMLEPLQ